MYTDYKQWELMNGVTEEEIEAADKRAAVPVTSSAKRIREEEFL